MSSYRGRGAHYVIKKISRFDWDLKSFKYNPYTSNSGEQLLIRQNGQESKYVLLYGKWTDGVSKHSSLCAVMSNVLRDVILCYSVLDSVWLFGISCITAKSYETSGCVNGVCATRGKNAPESTVCFLAFL